MQTIEYKMAPLLTMWIVGLDLNPFYWLSFQITQGDHWHFAEGKSRHERIKGARSQNRSAAELG